MRYSQIIELIGANGKSAKVMTAWIQDGNEASIVEVYKEDAFFEADIDTPNGTITESVERVKIKEIIRKAS